MNITKAIETLFKRFLPSPFTIAVLLTLLTLVLALPLSDAKGGERLFQVLSYWEDGIWNNGLLVFAYQMMLILVLGHVLVLSKPVGKLINRVTSFANDTQNAVVLVSITTMLVAFFNWGLGLIFGAILARKVGERAQEQGFSINYPLVGAAGYMGLMIWHGGMSGSAPLKVSEEGHLQELMSGISDASIVSQLPNLISTYQTIFSWWNLGLFVILLIIIPITLWWIAKKSDTTNVQLPTYRFDTPDSNTAKGAEKLDRSFWLSGLFGILVLLALGYQYWAQLSTFTLTPNMLNFFMFGMALLMHGSIQKFLGAVEEAIKGTSGILIQFPLYFGIMGIMKGSGMIQLVSDFFVSVATETTLPIFTFFSAGLVNIFVPSGGGQWAVQGPIVVESALKLGVPLPKIVMALAYGDQITNMLQPFWALPLLGITRLKAKEILPYTLIAMLVAAVVFIIGLLLI